MSAELRRELARHGLKIKPAAFLRLLARSMGGQQAILSDSSVNELSAAERKVLEEGGFDLEPREHKDGGPVERGLTDYAALIETGLSVAQAAERLGVHPSRIRQRLKERSLYGVQIEGEWLLPAFQFSGKRALPGLEAVVPRISAGIHPLSVFYFFTKKDVDLAHPMSGEQMSPRNWLRSGYSPEPVAELAATLGVS